MPDTLVVNGVAVHTHDDYDHSRSVAPMRGTLDWFKEQHPDDAEAIGILQEAGVEAVPLYLSDAAKIVQRTLSSGRRVFVEGHDPHYDADLQGNVQEVEEDRAGVPVLCFKDGTEDGPFHGKRVGLPIQQIKTILVEK